MQTIRELERQNSQRYELTNLERFLEESGVKTLSEILGVSVDVVRRFRSEGLTANEADTIACRLYSHPLFIWPSWSDFAAIPDGLMSAVEDFLVENKKCSMCGEWKSRQADFHKRTASPDGLARHCRPCSADYESLRRQRRLDLIDA